MKKVNFKVVLVALSFAFIFLLGVGSVGAQTGSSVTAGGTGVPANKATATIFALPQGNFQDPQTALITLRNEMTTIRANMAQMSDSSPIFIASLKLVKYYQRVSQNIEAGQSVAQAIVSGLGAFGASASNLTPAEMQALKNAAIALLD